MARQRECEFIARHMATDHVHMCTSIATKQVLSKVIGYLKAKSAITVARQFGDQKRNFNGENLWPRGYASVNGRL